MNYPALVNGYPLLYSDSGTYIVAGFIHYVPVDRPYFYSWLVRHSSMGFSLWLTLTAQSLLLFYAMRMALKYILKLKESFYATCAVLVGLSFLTGLAHNNSQIIADVFSPIALLCFCTLLAVPYIPRGHRFFLVVLMLFSFSVHSSHMLIFSILAIMLWLVRLIFKKKPFFAARRKTHRTLIVWSLASWLVVSLFNSWLGVGFKPSNTGNIFLVARCIETGAAKAYLDKYCPDAPQDLCAAKDSLPPHAVAFLWEFGNSPLYDDSCVKNGWGSCWTSKDKEYGKVVKGIIAYTPSRNILIEHCLKDSWKQLGMFDLGYLIPMAEGSPVLGPIRDYVNPDFERYKNAVQYQQTVSFETQSAIQRWAVYIAIAVILLFLLLSFRTSAYNNSLAFAIAVIVGCIVNGVVCASFSGVVDRYMARMIWLVPLAAVLLVWQGIEAQKQKEKI